MFPRSRQSQRFMRLARVGPRPRGGGRVLCQSAKLPTEMVIVFTALQPAITEIGLRLAQTMQNSTGVLLLVVLSLGTQKQKHKKIVDIFQPHRSGCASVAICWLYFSENNFHVLEQGQSGGYRPYYALESHRVLAAQLVIGRLGSRGTWHDESGSHRYTVPSRVVRVLPALCV